MDKTQHDNLPAVVTTYIDAIIKKMRYRKSVRAEVRQELTDHFADALADCTTEQEKQERANALIEQFGDAKLLGILLRRAKKRCRPLWRTMVVRMFQAVGILFVLLTAYVGWIMTGKPVVTTNYLEVLNQQVRPVVDESLNAWPYYKQAAEKYVGPTDEQFDISPRPLSTLTSQDREVLVQWIADNQKPLDLIRQGSQKPYYWQLYDTGDDQTNEIISVQLPHLGDYRCLAYMLCWKATLKVEAGNLVLAFEDVFMTYSFGRHLRGQHTILIEQLVAIAIEAMAAKEIRGIADAHIGDIDVDLLNSSRQRFQQKIDGQNFRISFETEKLFMYDELQRGFTQPRFGRTHVYVPRLRVIHSKGFDFLDHFFYFFHLHPMLLRQPGREQTRQQFEHYFNVSGTLSQKTPASLQKASIDIDQQLEEIVKENVFLEILAPALGRIVLLSYRSQTDSFATLTILAILQYEKTHGTYPDSLETLVEAGLLEAVPMDPFSDEPLVYQRTEEGFTVYSVGQNFTDNGGVPGTDRHGKPMVWADEGDAVFWPVLDK